MILMDIYMTLTTQWNNVKPMLTCIGFVMIVTCFLAAYKAGTLGRQRDFSCFNRIFDGPFSWFLIGIFLPMTARCCAAILSTLRRLLISLLFQFAFVGFFISVTAYATFFGCCVSKTYHAAFFRKTISFLAILTPTLITCWVSEIFVEFRQWLVNLAFGTSFVYDGFRHFCSFATKMFRTAQRAMNPLSSLYFSEIGQRGQL